ncbi:MAG TPA: ABC transporter C-terminal domain-containing protein, partial [Saprospiraceae bacterium]|nr:ABC transporter C-terminal domain-containing protein [Saprospiraceae bacterium]
LELQEQQERDKKASAPIVQVKSAAAISYEDQKEIQRLERDIRKLEEERNAVTEKFNDLSLTVEDIQKHSERLKKIEEMLAEKEMAWMELMEKYEN